MTTTTPRVRVKRDGPVDTPWRAMLRDDEHDELVGYFGSHDEAVRTGVTAARFVAAGVPWRPVNMPPLEYLPAVS